MTSIASIVKSRAPTRYFTQSGIVSSGDGGGDDDSDDNEGGVGSGGGDDDSDDDEGGVGSGGGSVVKALTALQAL